MPIEVNYDKNGNPKSILLNYEEYLVLLTRKEEEEVIRKIYDEVNNLFKSYFENQEDPSKKKDKIIDKIDKFGKDIRCYKNAFGYYTDVGFVVMKDSRASGNTSKTFRNIPSLNKLQKKLVEEGVLKKSGGDFIFKSDYEFTSPSAAACIVDGNSRSGPKSWGEK